MTHDHHHQQQHDHAFGGHHDYKQVAFSRLGVSLAITIVVMCIEVAGGLWTSSIALLGDAGHMLTHAFAIGVSMLGIWVARSPACHHRTFGLLRAEVLAALVNGIFLLLVSAWIVVASIQRFFHPTEILTLQMLGVAVLGLFVNLVSMYLLEGSRHNDLNVHSVFLHMVGDAASSVAIVGAALAIRWTGYTWIDPTVSIGIALWIAVWATGLLRESARILLEMAPQGEDVEAVEDALRAAFPEITATCNAHLWMITQERVLYSAKLMVDLARPPAEGWVAWTDKVAHWLHEEHGFAETTLHLTAANEGP